MEMAMTTSEAARRLRISDVHTVRLAEAGKIRFQRTALGRLYDRRSVEELAALRERDAA